MKFNLRSIVPILLVAFVVYLAYCNLYQKEGFWAAAQPGLQQYEATQRKYIGSLNELVNFYSSRREFMRAEKAKDLLRFHTQLLQDFLKINPPKPQPQPMPQAQPQPSR